MDTRKKFQSQDFGIAGIGITATTEEVQHIISGQAPLYSVETQHATEDALETVGRMIATGNVGPDDVRALANLEDILDEGLRRLEAMGEEVADF